MRTRDSGAVEPLLEPLTRREREILGLLAEGLSAPEIAAKLNLALSSVKWYVQRLYGKLGVNSKQRALLRANDLGLLGASRVEAPGRSPQSEAVVAPPKHNLPLQVTRFFGREDEIAQLKARLADHRLVTLAGSGGVGKTRLSLQVAEDLVETYADGVWFVGLAPLADPELVTQQVAASLRLRDEPGRPILETLTDHLRTREVLLVLDNCEHLLDACAHLAQALLGACPRLKILASSREPLTIAGEAIFGVPSLPFPGGAQPDASRLAEFASVLLFIDRTRLARPDYHLGPADETAIVRICKRLDGIPLALEMAASRMSVLTTEQLADRLDDAFRLLTGGSRTALPRQQTLRATIDWSYRLLTADQRLLLQRLSVFAGGCTLEAAEAVCSGDGLETAQVLDVLAALVAKSMVISEQPAGGEQRYHLLETVRQYAREKLNGANDASRLHAQHRDYFLNFAEAAVPHLQTKDYHLWRPKLEVETGNLRQAREWSYGDVDSLEATVRLILVDEFRYESHREGLNWMLRGLDLIRDRPDVPMRLRVKLMESVAMYQALDDPLTAIQWQAETVAVARAWGAEGRESLMWSLFHLASLAYWDTGNPQAAVTPMAEAEAILDELGPNYYEYEEGLRVRAFFAFQKAEMAIVQGRYHDAKALAHECIRLYEEAHSRFARVGYQALGRACFYLGEFTEARENFVGVIKHRRTFEGGLHEFELRWLAAIEIEAGNLAQALDYCRQSIEIAAAMPDRNIIATNLGLLAILSARQGQDERAARLSGASAALWAKQKRKPWEDSTLDTILPGWRDGPDGDAIQAAYDLGQAMTSDEAVAYALKNE